MVFWGIKKKKSAPDELPDLISDDIEKNSHEVNNFLKENEKKKEETPMKIASENKQKEEIKPEEKKEEDKGRASKEIISRLIKNIKEEEDKQNENTENKKKFEVKNKSFFEELQENLTEEIGDLSDLENWYEKKFLPRDILSDMKNYWEKQKTESILDLLGKNFQEKISVKISKLQELEKDWQSTYFELIEKEEEIKDYESELKDLLKEFVGVCKNKKKNLESNSVAEKLKNEGKKKKE